MIPFLVAGLLAKALGFSLEQYRTVKLRHSEECKGEDGEDPDCFNVLGPPPAEVRVHSQCAADDRSQLGHR